MPTVPEWPGSSRNGLTVSRVPGEVPFVPEIQKFAEPCHFITVTLQLFFKYQFLKYSVSFKMHWNSPTAIQKVKNLWDVEGHLGRNTIVTLTGTDRLSKSPFRGCHPYFMVYTLSRAENDKSPAFLDFQIAAWKSWIIVDSSLIVFKQMTLYYTLRLEFTPVTGLKRMLCHLVNLRYAGYTTKNTLVI